jgi:uncharacterized damage-inducible protein DinB
MKLETFQTMARYNRWMNERLLEACAGLSDEERKRDRAAPFRSIHGTWNHLLLADQVWLGRFQNRPFPIKTLADEIVSDFEELRRERARVDNEIDAFVASLTEERLAGPFSFVSAINPQRRTFPLWVVVQHLFNHQTHHRGQLTTLLEQAGVDFGVTDFMMLPGLQIQDT